MVRRRSAIEFERWEQADEVDPWCSHRGTGPVDHDVVSRACVGEQDVVGSEVEVHETISTDRFGDICFQIGESVQVAK